MKRKQIRVAVGVLIWKEEKVALIKRAGKYGADTWAPPGGHMEFGESALVAACRETMEEIGVEIKNMVVLGFTEDFSEEWDTHYITIWVQSDWASGELKDVDIEFTESGFFDMNDLPMPLFISFENLLAGKLLPFLMPHPYPSQASPPSPTPRPDPPRYPSPARSS